MYTEIKEVHATAHGILENATGGVTRYKRGKLVEGIIKEVWESLGGTVEKQKFLCTRNDKECYMGLDAVLYKDGEIKGLVECKSYLDLCYLERAEWNSRELTENGGFTVPMIILALEDSVKEASKDYILADGYVDEIFYLCKGKRQSNKPIYKKEFFKEINEKYFNTFYNYLENLFKN